MASQTHAPITPKPFALICSYKVPSTDLDPNFVPSVSVLIGSFDSQDQAKHARQAIKHTALIGAWCSCSFDDCSTTANTGGVQ